MQGVIFSRSQLVILPGHEFYHEILAGWWRFPGYKFNTTPEMPRFRVDGDTCNIFIDWPVDVEISDKYDELMAMCRAFREGNSHKQASFNLRIGDDVVDVTISRCGREVDGPTHRLSEVLFSTPTTVFEIPNITHTELRSLGSFIVRYAKVVEDERNYLEDEGNAGS